ncbi:component of the counting factor (CF) complex [Tieghemostelium lacteum]|uniref:Component of the counting factor (CF) complex n=1 Tax=Tieghemostelium lacteum TaxID=361077 RepID=A0A151Z704_TIELA|nr:component of the counting factor (CF) complex [Tieghemostelium lacteum]|eukprot:KYQ89742.1 component of the counting factor (CF) complex [Tieghemostelium lacteum]
MNKLLSVFLVFALIGAALSKETKFSVCPDCVNLVGNGMNQILNYILQGGVLGSCGALCSLIPNSAGQLVCDLACSYVGIEEFVKLISDVDPDPIYICEVTHLCPSSLTSNATIPEMAISPLNGTTGTTFSIGVAYNVTNEIGTGQIAIQVVDPTGNGFGTASLLVETPVGMYTSNFQFTATPSEQESFPSGEYQLQAFVCEGTCGTIHGDKKYGNRLLAQASTNFTIVNNGGSNSGSGSGSSSGSGSGSGSGQVKFNLN